MKTPRLPSRFENIDVTDIDLLKTIILKNKSALAHIRLMEANMKSSNSGSFLILKGESGAGKTTFINTLTLFMKNIEIKNINKNQDVSKALEDIKGNHEDMRIIVLENRESHSQVTYSSLEKDIISINEFIRSDKGKNNIVIWPCNGEEMVKELIYFTSNIGGSSLLRGDTILELKGPEEKDYFNILRSTFYFFNEEDVENYGVTESFAENIKRKLDKKTIGSFLENIRDTIIKNIIKINAATDYGSESFKLWIIVIAGNDPVDEIACLTQGKYANVDIQRLISSTNSNVVSKIGKNKNIIGLLAKEFDCRIIHIPYSRVTKSIIATKDERLVPILEDAGIKIRNSNVFREEILNSELVAGIRGKSINYKVGSKLKEDSGISGDFRKILKITQSNDRLINEDIGKILLEKKEIYSCTPEEEYGVSFTVRSDLVCGIEGNYLKLEMMWREKATRAEISEYVLKKLYNYASAMGIIN